MIYKAVITNLVEHVDTIYVNASSCKLVEDSINDKLKDTLLECVAYRVDLDESIYKKVLSLSQALDYVDMYLVKPKYRYFLLSWHDENSKLKKYNIISPNLKYLAVLRLVRELSEDGKLKIMQVTKSIARESIDEQWYLATGDIENAKLLVGNEIAEYLN
jgi:hypothetical protein